MLAHRKSVSGGLRSEAGIPGPAAGSRCRDYPRLLRSSTVAPLAARLRALASRMRLRRRMFLRRGLDEFVGIDVFDGALQREADRRGELGGLVLAGRTHVVEVLFLHRIDRQVADARVFTDQHAAVNRIAGSDEEDAAVFEHLQRVGSGHSGIHGDERAGGAVAGFRRRAGRIP